MREKCLVLGADGFIGSHLVDELLQRNFDVRVFGRFSNNTFKNLNHVKGKIEVYSGDFNKKRDVAMAIKGVDYVFHLISFSNPAITSRNPLKEIKVNLVPTIRLLELASKNNVKKIIFPSSGGSIYGISKEKYFSENSLLHPITPYAINKLTIESYLYYYFNQRGLDYIIYRISTVYGERQTSKYGQGVIERIIRQTLRNEAVTIYGDTMRDYIHVKDVATLIAKTFDRKTRYKTYNVGSGQGILLSQLLATIEKTINKKIQVKQMESRPFDLDHVILDIARIKKEFLFKQTIDLTTGIARMYEYIKGERTK